LDDITFRACGPLIQAGFGTATGPGSAALCQGGSAVYNISANVVGDNNPVYQWQSDLNGAGWTDMTGSTNSSISVPFNNATPGVYQYRLGIANGSAITSVQCRVYSQPLTITVNPLPIVPPIPDQTVCYGNQLILTASGGATYSWTGPGLAATSQNPLVINNVSPANAGIYTVVAASDSGCTAAPVQVKVSVVPQIIPGISANVAICAGESTQLTATGGIYYRWTPTTGLDNDTIASPMATPLQTTTYTAHIGNGGCVDSSKSVTITVNQNPIAQAGSEIYLFQGQSAKLKGSITGDNIVNYYWSPATYLDDPTSLTPIATPPSDITYTLTAVSATCGTSTSSVFVRVYQKITIPNTFSPNHDGINDYWNIDKLNTYPESIAQVFNRYGQRVFQSTGYASPWDGTDNGKPLPAGTYYYIIDLKNGQPKLSGWVLLLR
jgi:gliding motility-associated-like protein